MISSLRSAWFLSASQCSQTLQTPRDCRLPRKCMIKKSLSSVLVYHARLHPINPCSQFMRPWQNGGTQNPLKLFDSSRLLIGSFLITCATRETHTLIPAFFRSLLCHFKTNCSHLFKVAIIFSECGGPYQNQEYFVQPQNR